MTDAELARQWQKQNEHRMIYGNCKCRQTIDACEDRQRSRRHTYDGREMEDVVRGEFLWCIGCQYEIPEDELDQVFINRGNSRSVLTKEATSRTSRAFSKRINNARKLGDRSSWRTRLPPGSRWAL